MSEPALTEAALLERIALGEHTRQQFKRSFNFINARRCNATYICNCPSQPQQFMKTSCGYLLFIY